MVEFYRRIADATAKRLLLLDLHSAYIPDGLQRAYPNFITQEGVQGSEWNKMNKNITPRHNLMLPYTRMLAGPMDYTQSARPDHRQTRLFHCLILRILPSFSYSSGTKVIERR